MPITITLNAFSSTPPHGPKSLDFDICCGDGRGRNVHNALASVGIGINAGVCMYMYML